MVPADGLETSCANNGVTVRALRIYAEPGERRRLRYYRPVIGPRDPSGVQQQDEAARTPSGPTGAASAAPVGSIALAGYIWPAALRFLRERPNAGDGGGELAGVERQERRPAAEVECVAGRARELVVGGSSRTKRRRAPSSRAGPRPGPRRRRGPGRRASARTRRRRGPRRSTGTRRRRPWAVCSRRTRA